MYMSEILMMAEDLGMKWFEFPLDSCPTLTIHWEYGVCYPLTRYFEVPPGTAAGSRGDAATGSIPEEEEEEEDDKQEQLFLEELSGYSEAVLYFNPVRHSMMLFAVSPCFGENGRRSMKEIVVGDGKKKQLADGGRAWIPHIELAHEFSLLPGLKPCEMKQPLPGGNCRTMMHSQRVERGLRGMMPGARFSSSYSDQLHCLELGGEGAGDGIMTWGGVTSGCSSVQASSVLVVVVFLVVVLLVVVLLVVLFVTHGPGPITDIFLNRTCRTGCLLSGLGRCPTSGGPE